MHDITYEKLHIVHFIQHHKVIFVLPKYILLHFLYFKLIKLFNFFYVFIELKYAYLYAVYCFLTINNNNYCESTVVMNLYQCPYKYIIIYYKYLLIIDIRL